jgi:ketosteroid isomerase-like protein
MYENRYAMWLSVNADGKIEEVRELMDSKAWGAYVEAREADGSS